MSRFINSQPPDVTVIVGNKRVFKCYKAILAYASPTLDAMLSIDMIESQTQVIRFPDKDPDEFEMVLKCIDPANFSLFELYDSNIEPEPYRIGIRHKPGYKANDDELINLSNVEKLVPWFSELQMWRYLFRCEAILNYHAFKTGEEKQLLPKEERIMAWRETHQEVAEFIRLLSFAARYNLQHTQHTLEYIVTYILEVHLWGLGDSELFNLTDIQNLVEVFLPLTPLNDGGVTSYEAANGRYLWNRIIPCLNLSEIPLDTVNDAMELSRIVCNSLNSYHRTMKLKLNEILSDLTSQEGPCNISFACGTKATYEVNRGEVPEMEVIEGHLAYVIPPYRSKRVRNYRFDKDSKTIRLHCVESERYDNPKPEIWDTLLCHKNDEDEDEEESQCTEADLDSVLCQKHDEDEIRCMEADLTVVIGCGADVREYSCSAALLSFSSVELDSMMSKSSATLHLPQFNPNDWALFYRYVCPRDNGASFYSEDVFDAIGDVRRLAPWFKEFEMSNHLNCCRRVMQEHAAYIDRSDIECYSIEDSLDLYRLAAMLDLDIAKGQYEDLLRYYIGGTSYETDWQDDEANIPKFEIMQEVISICLPIERASIDDDFSSKSCPNLWRSINSFIGTHLKALSYKFVDSQSLGMFSHLVIAYFRIEAKNALIERLSNYV